MEPSSDKSRKFRRARKRIFACSAATTLGLLISATAASVAAQEQTELEPARVSCNSAYSTPCARTNARWLAVQCASSINRQLAAAANDNTFTTAANRNTTATLILEDNWEGINNQSHNMDVGFYPFVFDKYTGIAVAHGGMREMVGLDLDGMFDAIGIGFSRTDHVLERFIDAAESPEGGDWVRYLWSDTLVNEGESIQRPRSKLTYVVGVADRYLLGVGYENQEFPTDLPCSASYDSWCSITNVRSLLGRAQFLLTQTESIAQFEDATFTLSYDAEVYQLPGGYYTFLYDYDGTLKSHALLHGDLGNSFSQIITDRSLGTEEEANNMHNSFIRAAEGYNGGWVQYQWRPGPGEPSYTKIGFFVKITFEGEKYYLGSGFNFASEIEEAAKDDSDEACSDKYNLPCAFETSLQLSSHVLTHAVSSPLSTNEIWAAVSEDPKFKSGDYYAYAYDFNGTCVSHGAAPQFAGMTLAEVFAKNNITLDADELHNQYRKAAEAGGGWVLYDWLIPGVENSMFPKIAYLFQITLEGRNYYGGVGFNHHRAPVAYSADNNATRMDGSPIPCSREYGLECSDTNVHAILGQAVGELTLASSDARFSQFTPTGKIQPKMHDIVNGIIHRNPAFTVLDFYVIFFAVDGSECGDDDDGSGCCIAHGADPSLVGKTWQQILDKNGVTSIPGRTLHSRLTRESHTTGGYVDYSYSGETGEARMMHAVTANYKDEGRNYYAISEYFKTPLPPTCDSCLPGTECTKPTQSFCKKIPASINLPSIIPWVVAIALLAGMSIALFYWYKRRNMKKRKTLSMKIEKMEDQLKNMVQIEDEIPVPCTSASDYKARFGQEGVEAAGSPYFETDWGWEEDKDLIARYGQSEVMAGSNFVKYSEFLSNEIEQAYRRWKSGEGAPRFKLDLTYQIEKVYDQTSGYCYILDFQTMRQTNVASRYTRGLRREYLVVEVKSDIVDKLPPLPADIDFFCHDGEDFLPTFAGQVIQVSKEHPSKEWLYGSVLYDPLVVDATKNPQSASLSMRRVQSKALHDRPTSGWFPSVLSKAADPEVMKKIVDAMGEGAGTLKRPDTWEPRKSGLVAVPKDSYEYDEVVRSFLDTLHHHQPHASVVDVQRIQSFPLWQSYAVKKETMKKRDRENPAHLVHNKDPDGMERQWLFHGTTSEIIPKIIKQGFNRAFAGRNAVAFGKGVYFARDAAYSCNRNYATPDADGTQHIFLCRVVVGDWCKGSYGQLTPNSKPGNQFDLFDSTVDDAASPSIFVVYHDAQAYPDYLVSFKRDD